METKFSILTLPCQPDMADQIAEVQQVTLAGYPLFEGYICPNCGWRSEPEPKGNDRKSCFRCSSHRTIYEMIQCGPRKAIISDLLQHEQKPGTTCIIAQVESTIIGFVQGFTVPADQELDGFLGRYKTHRLISDEYFFIDKIAIIPNFQNQDICRKLIVQILDAQTCEKALLWTQENGALFRLILAMGGELVWNTRRIGVFMMLSTRT